MSNAQNVPELDLYFYRLQTHGMLRRYFYTSLQTSRVASSLADPIGRGWVSSQPIRTFEDAVIFVHDMERCLRRLNSLDRDILNRVVIQEYTHAEAASLLGMSVRIISYKLPIALDRFTTLLLNAGLLILPEPEKTK